VKTTYLIVSHGDERLRHVQSKADQDDVRVEEIDFSQSPIWEVVFFSCVVENELDLIYAEINVSHVVRAERVGLVVILSSQSMRVSNDPYSTKSCHGYERKRQTSTTFPYANRQSRVV
jgi:hypothetical protein